MKTVKEKVTQVFDSLKEKFSYTNTMQAPRIEKVVVAAGIGSITDKQKIKLIPERLAQITGQRPVENKAKVSIATFKLREGNTIGYTVTLRGQRMYDFLERLINIALPRTRDFRGLEVKGIDEMGNYTLGIKEHTIFPETSDEDIKNVFGFGITIVTTSKTKAETEALLRQIGMPLKEGEGK